MRALLRLNEETDPNPASRIVALQREQERIERDLALVEDAQRQTRLWPVLVRDERVLRARLHELFLELVSASRGRLPGARYRTRFRCGSAYPRQSDGTSFAAAQPRAFANCLPQVARNPWSVRPIHSPWYASPSTAVHS